MIKGPATNNALESTNGKIKMDFNFHVTQKMSVFKEKPMIMVKTHSVGYKDGVKHVNWAIPMDDLTMHGPPDMNGQSQTKKP